MFSGGIARLVVSPSDALSSIGPERLIPHPTLEQIDSEVEPISKRIGETLCNEASGSLRIDVAPDVHAPVKGDPGLHRSSDRIPEDTKKKVSKVQETEDFGFENINMNINTVWVDESSPEMAHELKKMLGTAAHVYVGPTPQVSDPPSSVVFCSNGEDAASHIGRLRALSPDDASILALSSSPDPHLARETLLAGGHGFIHLGMKPAQVFRALSATSKSETLVPKALLVAFLEEKLSREHITALTPDQREFLELIVASGIFEEEIIVPRKLLEAFLRYGG